MIFLTVGTQLPFERLIQYVDQWAEKNQDIKVFGQIGKSNYNPRFMEYCDNLCSIEFHSMIQNSDLVVSHAGMGTIITSLALNKPVLIVPRDSDFGEHRNQHQKSTCKRFEKLEGVYVAEDFPSLSKFLDRHQHLASGMLTKANIEFCRQLESKIDSLLLNSER